MESKNTGNDCSGFRSLFDRIADGDSSVDAGALDFYRSHGSECQSCKSWKEQTEMLADIASGLPQFDVSEALTQRILSAASQERRKEVAVDLPGLPLGVAGLVLMVAVVPFESLEGALSWALGLIGLFVFKLLLNTAGAKEQMS